MNEQQEQEKQEEPKLEQKPEKKDTKWFFMIIILIIGAFALFFVVRHITTPTGYTIEDMHNLNLEGKAEGENYVYNGYSFVKIGQMWNTQLQLKDTLVNLMLRYSPKELEDVTVTGRFDSEGFNQGYVYITFDPDGENLQYVALAAADISTSLGKALKVKPIAACSKNITEACKDRPIITCENEEPTIYLKQSESEEDTAIIFIDKCVVIKGKDFNLVRAADRFLLAWYKIMPF